MLKSRSTDGKIQPVSGQNLYQAKIMTQRSMDPHSLVADSVISDRSRDDHENRAKYEHRNLNKMIAFLVGHQEEGSQDNDWQEDSFV